MRTGRAALAATIALAIVAAALPAGAAATEVRLLVEGPAGTEPLFDGRVETDPHAVDGGDGSGAHPCWGPPGSGRSPTPTGALDDAMRAAGIGWRGDWNPSFGDFFVDRIGPYESAAPDRYWSISVGGRHSAGGCLAALRGGEEVRFRYGPLFDGAGEDDGGADGGGEAPEPGGGERESGGGPESRETDRVASPSHPRVRPRLAARRAHRFLRRARRGRDATGLEWARLALSVRRGRGAPRAAAALLGPRPRAARRGGRRAADPNATALAVLALNRGRPLPAAQAARRLAAAQLPSGGLGHRAGAPADADTTGLAAWALAVSGRTGAARRAAGCLLGTQAPGGGFAALPGGEPNAQSTGLALAGLRAAGRGPRAARAVRRATAYLASLARRDGSIAYAPGAAPTPAWTTAQALLGMTSRARLLFKGAYR